MTGELQAMVVGDPAMCSVLDVVMPGPMEGLGALAVFKKIDHSPAKAEQREAAAAAAGAAAVRATVAPEAQPARPPAISAAAAADPGNCPLNQIARTAAKEAERQLILRMLRQTRWNRKQTAELDGISYKAFVYKTKKNGLDKAS